MTTFIEKLQAKWNEGKFVCVGLDSDLNKLPYASLEYHDGGSSTQFEFNRRIIDATKDIVCAYKPNAAFYEVLGAQGIVDLTETIQYIHRVAPDVAVILDAKLGDIGNTNNGYVEFAFDLLDADALTVSPYLGMEAVKPFLDRADKGVILLCRTSNSGAGEFQDQAVPSPDGNGTVPLYQLVAHNISKSWNYNGNCAVVVGATYPDELNQVRQIIGDMPILIPGIGAQGGNLEATVRAGASSSGKGMIVNSSRGIIFASSGQDFADAARQKTRELHDSIISTLKG